MARTSAGVLAFSHATLLLATAPMAAALVDYYTGRSGAALARPPGPAYHDILQTYLRGTEPLHPEHVVSLLGTNKSDILKPHPRRFLADGVLSKEGCKKLRDMFDRHKPEIQTTHNDWDHTHPNEMPDFMADRLPTLVDDEDFPLLLAVRQRMVQAVQEHLDPGARAEHTQLIHRVGHKDNQGMPTHADNCQYQWGEDVCRASDVCCAWRSHTVFTYLSDDNVDGGEFYIARDSANARHGRRREEDLAIKVRPKCGQMVGFSSGGENLHGVLPLKSGSRYSIGLWLTKDQGFTELLPGEEDQEAEDQEAQDVHL